MQSQIEKYRKANNMSRGQLGKKAGMSRQLIEYHEKNPDRPWSYQKAILIDQATNGAVRWIDLVNGKS